MLELERQKHLISPRGIQQGWREEIRDNIAEHRTLITQYKIEALFERGLVRGKCEVRHSSVHSSV